MIKINFFLSKDFEKKTLRFVIVSSVSPDFETIIKQEFFKFLIFLNCKLKFISKLSKKNTFFFIFFLKKEYILFVPKIDQPIPTIIILLNLENFLTIDGEKSDM